jgi:phosphatidylglycerophosphate synthase
MSSTPVSASITAATFLAQNRGGGLYSESLSQRAGAYLALAAYRLRWSPSAVTVAALVIGVGASVTLVALAARTATGGVPAVVTGLAVGLGWQLAYALDCADGQLARVTGRASANGARLDILCDVAVQISVVAGIVAVTDANAPRTPAWLYATFAGTWMVNLVTSALASGPASASLISARSPAVRVAKLVRDYGAVVAVCALVIALAPGATVWLLVLMSVINGLFLVASIAAAARAAFFRTGS